MAEYISRDDLLNVINANVAEAHNERCSQLLEAILNAPTADVVECKHGEWIIDTSCVERTFYEINYKVLITCSICGNRHFLGTQPYRNFTQEDLKKDSYRKYRYCGNCGAKMDGGKVSE